MMKSSIGGIALALALGSQASVILDLGNDSTLGDIGNVGTSTGFNNYTVTLYANSTLTTLSTNSAGSSISFDLMIQAAATRYFTQGADGLGTATGSTGTAQDIFHPLTLSISNVSGTNGIVITEAQFFAVDSGETLTANEITISTSSTFVSSRRYSGDFIDTTTLALNAGDNESGGMRVEKLTFEAIPEPATLGLVTVMGAGILFIRRTFML